MSNQTVQIRAARLVDGISTSAIANPRQSSQPTDGLRLSGIKRRLRNRHRLMPRLSTLVMRVSPPDSLMGIHT